MRSSFRYAMANDCPDVRTHTWSPAAYLAWHEWAEKKAKTHVQVKCPTCGFYSVWVPKKRGQRA